MATVAEPIRELFSKQRSGAKDVLARHYPLPPGVLGDSRWNAFLIHCNPRLCWPEILMASPPPMDIRFETLSKLIGDFWSEELIHRFAASWDWEALSGNPSLPWSTSLIQRFEERWDWPALSLNRGVPFSVDLLGAFEERWVFSRLAANGSVPWNGAMLGRYQMRLSDQDPSWHPMMEHERPEPVAPGITLRKDGWAHLQQNPDVNWGEVLDLLPAPDWLLLSANRGLPWGEKKFITRHSRVLDYTKLSGNPALPWDGSLFARLQPHASPVELSGNPGLHWSEKLVRRHADLWVWHMVSRNPGVPWTVALLEDVGDRVDWKKLSAHGQLSPEVLERFQDQLDWGTGVSFNRQLPWDEGLIEAHQSRWQWERLGFNTAIPWSDALIDRFAHRWKLSSFVRHDAGWEAMAPHLDDDWLRAWLRGAA